MFKIDLHIWYKAQAASARSLNVNRSTVNALLVGWNVVIYANVKIVKIFH